MAKKIRKRFTSASLIRLVIFFVLFFAAINYLSLKGKNKSPFKFSFPSVLGTSTLNLDTSKINTVVSETYEKVIKYSDEKIKEIQRQIIKSVSDSLIKSIK